MEENVFETLAEQTLQGLFEAIEEAGGDSLEVDLEGGILTIELDDGRTYVVNRQAPLRQIWLSSPASGAHHFDFDPDRRAWLSTRGGAALMAILEQELLTLAGVEVELS